MTSDDQMDLDAGPGLIAGPARKPANPLHVVHRMLRGRYVFALIAVTCGALLCGLGGYFSQTVIYQSRGLIRVSPSVPRILFQSEQNGLMPRFDSFVDSQVTLIQSQRLVEFALQNERWRALKRPMTPESTVEFMSNLVVARPKNSDLIIVSVSDPDPTAAQIGVQAVIEAYDQLYGENDADSVSARMKVLEDRRSKLDQELKQWQERIRSIANALGSGSSRETLDQMHRAKLEQVAQLETQLRSAELNIALASGTGVIPEADPADAVHAETPIEALARRSDELRQLLAQRFSLQQRLDSEAARLGERHRDVLQTRGLLEKVNERVDALVKELRSQPEPLVVRDGHNSGLKSVAQLKAEEANVRALYERIKSEAMELGRRSVEVASLQQEADAAQAKLLETRQRIEQLEVESTIGGRIRIESKGDQPLAPSRDKRQQFAIVGALGGGAAGLGIILLIGFFDRRVMTIADVRGTNTPLIALLGVLPQLPENLGDPEQAMIAAHAVHQIRATLQHRHHESATPVFAITSSSPGAGKTSLTMALSLSFAASGSSVLMIDCDIIGGGLTSKIKKVTRRRIGRILKRQRLLTAEQINEVLRVQSTTSPREKFGKLAVELGFVTADQLESALEAQKVSMVGLREAMAGDPALECIASTGTPGLYVMPLGSATRQHAGQFSYSVLRKIINQVKTRFEVIIIDTGPILGSIEAMVVAAVADESILTVAKGEHRPVLEEAIEKLLEGQHRIAGIVLNRAETPDIRISGMSFSMSRRSGEPVSALPPVTVIEHEQLTLGPVANAVASSSQGAEPSTVPQLDHKP
jgi:uncharacterized protein involved in exopolysaccharide biosynthesis/Mrp family chromosome partitioning ATPase